MSNSEGYSSDRSRTRSHSRSPRRYSDDSRSRSRSRTRSYSDRSSRSRSRSRSRSPSRTQSDRGSSRDLGGSRDTSGYLDSRDRSPSRSSEPRSYSRDDSRTPSRTPSRSYSRSRSRSRTRSRSYSRSQSPYSDRSRSSGRYRDDYSDEEYSRTRTEYTDDDSRDRERRYSDEAYTEDETEHYSDESSNDRNSDEEEEDEEEAKERDGNRILFVEMPQPKMSDDKRTLEDDYALGLQENIKHIQEHILDIQKREIEKMNAYAQSLNPSADPKKEDSERKKFEQSLTDIRDERRKYRALLYDAVKERNDLLESRDIARVEERIAKNRADRVDKYNGIDVTQFFLFLLQVGLTVLYIIFMDFTSDPSSKSSDIYGYSNNVEYVYVFVIDIAMMVFLGFTMQRAFLRKYAYSAIGYSLMTASIAFLWGILWHGWFDWEVYQMDSKITLTMSSLVHGLYCATAVLVAYGAVVGRTNTIQTVVMAFLGSFFYSLNYFVTVGEIKSYDVGGAMTVHLFGALFGIGVSFWLGLHDTTNYTAPGQHEHSSYNTDVFSFLGTVVLFILFPSFNAAFAADGAQFRVVINTALACLASGVGIIGLDWMCGPQKFRAFVLQHGVMAGGIIMGCAHSELVPAYVAIILGALVAAPCTWIGLRKITPFMNRSKTFASKQSVSLIPKDTAGVLFAHGVPGFIGGLAGIAATADYKDKTDFGQTESDLFPRDPSGQPGDLAATWAISMGIGLASGMLVGIVMLMLKLVLPTEHVSTKRRPAPALGFRPFHDEIAWRELPLDIDE